jgi:class 3 adenylate cyclase
MQAVMNDSAARVVSTVMFTDIVGSTARLATVGDAAWKELLVAHNARLRAELNVQRGREVKTTGDGFLAVFDSPTRAARAALAMIVSARAADLPIRVGMHTGEVELVDGDVRGIAVHAAARVMSVAGPSEVALSSTTAALLEGSGIEVEEAGAHELKGLTGVRQVFRLVEAGTG